MYESAINQVYTLCSIASVSSVNSGRGEFVDAAVRARIFWYAYAHEGITTGLRGGRLLLYDSFFIETHSCTSRSNVRHITETKTICWPLKRLYP